MGFGLRLGVEAYQNLLDGFNLYQAAAGAWFFVQKSGSENLDFLQKRE